MTNYQLPTIEGLDKTQSDYVQKLDEGIRKVDEIRKAHLKELSARFEQAHGSIAAAVKGIEGIVVKELPEISDFKSLGGEKLRGYSLKGTLITGFNVKQEREVEDAIRECERSFEDYQRDSEDRLLDINRAGEDFRDAIMDLTEIKPLSNLDPRHKTLHLYVPITRKGEEGVYELHMNIDLKNPKVIGPRKHPSLTPESVSEEGFLEKFRQEYGEEVEANVYLVRNPSSVIPLSVLYTQGLIAPLKARLEYVKGELEERKSQERENAPKTFTESLRKAIRKLLG